MPDSYDIAIAGAGPAGCVAATVLARRGYTVVMIDPFLPVAQRIESLPENGQTLLAELDLIHALKPAFIAPAQAVQMQWRSTPERRDFGTEAPVLLNRARLHASLKTHALAAGAKVLTGRVTDIGDSTLTLKSDRGHKTIKATVILDARGRSAKPRQRLSEPRIALPFKATSAGHTSNTMIVEALKTAWIWAAPNGQGHIEGALFVAPRDLGGLDAQMRWDHLREQLSGSSLSDAQIEDVAAPVPSDLSAISNVLPYPRTICIGDAALARDPISSHGLVYAFRSAAQAVAAACSMLGEPEEADAARDYLTHRHALDCEAARRATAQAYADQSRHRSDFWPRISEPREPETKTEFDPSMPLVLNCIPEQVPHLTAHKIVWANGLRVVGTDTRLSRCGPFPANAIIRALAEPADAATLGRRLAQFGSTAYAQQVVDHLISIQALVPEEADQDARRSRL